MPRKHQRASLAQVIAALRRHADPKNVLGMARYGISPKNVLGVAVPILRGMARDLGHDHKLAEALWHSGIHDARILAAYVGEADKVTPQQLKAWLADVDSWDICDQLCSNLLDQTPFAVEQALKLSYAKPEFVKRAGFVLMAALAVHDKRAPDSVFEAFLAAIERECTDDRNFVRKAVNWALRQIGKRNQGLNKLAVAAALRIQQRDSKAARWIAADALRELSSPAVQARLARTARK